MQYQVIVTSGTDERDETVMPVDEFGKAWTAENTVKFAHMRGIRMADNTWIRIARRRGPRSTWVPYREYTVTDGIARRTDR